MDETYPNAHYLADVDWLHGNLDRENVRIIDARFDVRIGKDGQFEEVPGREAYEQGHIPGAQFVDLYGDLADPQNPTSIIGPKTFAALMSRLGINADSTVVIYDDRGGVWAARLWWALRYYGHNNVKMLNGGLTAWKVAKHSLESTIHTPPPANFIATAQQNLRTEKRDVLAAIDDPAISLVDALPAPFFRGLAGLYPSHQKGHIPSAVNIPAEDNLDPDTLCLKPMLALNDLWAPAAITPKQKIITYCGGGIYASFALFVLALMGHENAVLYDASWMEWGRDAALPVETGRAKAH
jgi:thiosulfate/3-mercaptopyruvate sulfurtransferase